MLFAFFNIELFGKRDIEHSLFMMLMIFSDQNQFEATVSLTLLGNQVVERSGIDWQRNNRKTNVGS